MEQSDFILNTNSIKSTFHKQERLCSKKEIDFLFKNGKVISSKQINLFFCKSIIAKKFSVQAMFVVPKKNFKKAHDRNKLKRRMRESYRKIKSEIYLDEKFKSLSFNFAFVFKGREELSYQAIDELIIKLVSKFRIQFSE